MKNTAREQGYVFDGEMIKWEPSMKVECTHEQGCAGSETGKRENNDIDEGLKRKEQMTHLCNYKKRKTGMHTAVIVKVQHGGRLIP